jgi:hypothetical protein
VIVHLTERQLDATMTAFDQFEMGWVNDYWLEESGVKSATETVRECIMPAAGWLQALNLLVELTVGPLGGNRRDTKLSATTARRKIAAALHLYAAHPALFGVGLVGTHTDVFPVWQVVGAEKPGRLYDIFPMPGAIFVHLHPMNDGPFTTWHGQHVLSIGVGLRSVLDEEEHLRFVSGRAVAPDAPASH